MMTTLTATPTLVRILLARHERGADQLNRRCLRALRAATPDPARVVWLAEDHRERQARLEDERRAAFTELDRDLDAAYGHDSIGHDGGPAWYEPVLSEFECHRFED